MRMVSVDSLAPQCLPATQMIASFVQAAHIDALSRHHAARALVDTLAVTVAGGAEPAARAVERSLTPSVGSGTVPSFWSKHSYHGNDAALLFGTASHVLDYDDVSMLAVCHPSAPTLSALLAASPAGCSGTDLLDALVVGTEVLIRLGQAMGFRHYALGFHATATLGSVGSAAACARLLRLNLEQTSNAISIAASQSSGLRKNFGTMVKSLHVGIAAMNGLRSVRLALAGLHAANESIEGDGFLRAFSGGETDEWPESVLLGAPFAIASPGFEQKRYPCCYMLHKIIEGTLGLRRENTLTLEGIEKMRVEMAIGGTKPLIHPYPKTGLNALFSAPYAVLAGLHDGRIDLKSFTDEAVLRPHIQGRLQDVEVIETNTQAAGAKDIGAAPVTVTVLTKDGRKLASTVKASPGSLEDPLSDADVSAKWLDCLQRARSEVSLEVAQELLADGLDLAKCDNVLPWLRKMRDVVFEGRCDE